MCDGNGSHLQRESKGEGKIAQRDRCFFLVFMLEWKLTYQAAVLYVCLSVCEHCNEYSAGRTWKTHTQEGRMLLKDMLHYQDVRVWTGFSWRRIASVSGLSHENGNRQVTFLSSQ